MVIDHCSYDFFTISYRHHISDISTLILTFDQGCQKLPLLTPKKCKNEGQKKGNSPNPCWHGLFAKKRVQIGLIWPPWPRLYFTSAYRGSPPCTLFQHPGNREIGYSNVLPPPLPPFSPPTHPPPSPPYPPAFSRTSPGLQRHSTFFLKLLAQPTNVYIFVRQFMRHPIKNLLII